MSSFERGALLGWKLESCPDYRDSPETSWRVVPIAADARELSLADLIEDVTDLPALTVTPALDGMVRVRSELALLVQPFGEGGARIVRDGVATLGYGSVVRAGPLLIAPLFAEQAESIELGHLKLPEPPDQLGMLAAEEHRPSAVMPSPWRRFLPTPSASNVSALSFGLLAISFSLYVLHDGCTTGGEFGGLGLLVGLILGVPSFILGLGLLAAGLRS